MSDDAVEFLVASVFFAAALGLIGLAAAGIMWWFNIADLAVAKMIGTWSGVALTPFVLFMLLVHWSVCLETTSRNDWVEFHTAFVLVALGLSVPISGVVLGCLPPEFIILLFLIAIGMVYYFRDVSTSGDDGRSEIRARKDGMTLGFSTVPLVVFVLWLARSSVIAWWAWLIGHFTG